MNVIFLIILILAFICIVCLGFTNRKTEADRADDTNRPLENKQQELSLEKRYSSLLKYYISLIDLLKAGGFSSHVLEESKNLIVSGIVSCSLSLIGRKTSETENFLINSSSEEVRGKVEKYFLDMLKSEYPDEKVMTILMRHFMLFKEAMLFDIFHSLLGNGDVYDEVSFALKSRLSEGQTRSDAKEQEKYRYAFLKHFQDVFMQSRQIQIALPFSFWNTAVEKYPKIFTSRDALDIVKNYYLCNIYAYMYEVIEGTLKDVAAYIEAKQ